MRVFAAVLLPQDVVAHLDAAVTPHRDGILRWTTPDSWHLTLAFYGEVPEGRVPDLKARLTISLGLAGAGRFGQRALWIGCGGDLMTLRELARSVRAAGRRVGAPAEERRFKAHVTVARAPKPVDLRPYVSALGSYRGPSWTAAAVALVRSHLGGGENRRARYETVSSHPLSA